MLSDKYFLNKNIYFIITQNLCDTLEFGKTYDSINIKSDNFIVSFL